MDRLPQVQQYNPALVPKVNFFINLPAIGFEQIEVNNSGFKLGQFLNYSDQLGSPNYNPDEFVNSIGEFNKTTIETRSNLFSFGFSLKKKGYFSLGVCQRNILDVTAPSEIVYLLDDYDKIRNRMPIHVNGINFQLNSFSQISFTLAKTFNEKLTVGITPKLIGAVGGISSEKLTLDVEEIEPNEYDANYEGKMWVGLPIPINPLAIKPNGELDPDQPILDDDWSEQVSIGQLFQNPGLAVDLGVNYQLNPIWSFSASFLDIGKSVWKKNAYQLTYSTDNSWAEEVPKLSVKIPSKLFVGANYALSPNWNAGALFKSVFYESGSYHSGTISLNGYLGSMLSTSISYSAGKSFDNLGFGLRLRFLPGTDFYLVTDNILHAINYKDIQYSAIAAGINLSFGVRAKKQEDIVPEKIVQ
jgi:hypothetical protein